MHCKIIVFVCCLFFVCMPFAWSQKTKENKRQSIQKALSKIKEIRKNLDKEEQKIRTLQKQFSNKKKKLKKAKPSQSDELRKLKELFQKQPAPKSVQKPSPRASTNVAQRPGFVQRLANLMNPAISAIGIFAAGWTSQAQGHCHADGVCFGPAGIFSHTHDPARTGLNLQQLEVTFQAAVDPFFSAMVVMSMAEGEGVAELEIEEAYMQTTSLPWFFQIKAGKFLSDLTRLGSKHLHDLDFVTISMPLRLAVGGEMRHLAVQLTWLAPLPFYLRLGAEISYGGSVAFPVVDPSIPVLMGHFRAFFDITDSARLLLGGGVGYGIWDRANTTAADLSRFLVNAHILFQWRPVQRNNFFMLKFMAEYYGNWSQCDPAKSDTSKPQFRQYCFGTNPTQVTTQALHGITSKVVLRFAQQWQTGVRFEWMQQLQPSAQTPTHRLSGMIVFVATEFSRIRLEYNGANLFDNTPMAHSVWLQAQFSIGAHGAHKF